MIQPIDIAISLYHIIIPYVFLNCLNNAVPQLFTASIKWILAKLAEIAGGLPILSPRLISGCVFISDKHAGQKSGLSYGINSISIVSQLFGNLEEGKERERGSEEEQCFSVCFVYCSIYLCAMLVLSFALDWGLGVLGVNVIVVTCCKVTHSHEIKLMPLTSIISVCDSAKSNALILTDLLHSNPHFCHKFI